MPNPSDESHTDEAHYLLRTGETCWRLEQAEKFAMLVDGDAYFRIFVEVCRKAERSILVAGWDIDSRVDLNRSGSGEKLKLGRFLNDLAGERPDLEIRLLCWDFAMIFLLERQVLPVFTLGWNTRGNIHFIMDGEHPFGGSHHQKIVVIDDRLAFCGGLDLTRNRWDTPEHDPNDERRRDSDGQPYKPFHDVQAMVQGEVAEALGDLFRWRWLMATGKRLPRVQNPSADLWPEGVKPDAEDVRVGVVRTMPRYKAQEEVREIKALYLEAVARAETSIYLENQYLTSTVVTEALAERLSDKDGPEIVVVLPERSSGWLEQEVMDGLRARMLGRLLDADSHGRLRIFYPHIPGLGDECMHVHSKVLVVDGRLAMIGSANVSNRSMGLDTECNLCLEAEGQPETATVIASLRNRLLAEHLDVSEQEVDRAVEREGSLIAALEALRNEADGDERTLLDLPRQKEPSEGSLLPDSSYVDPERPVAPERMMDEFAPEQRESGKVNYWIVGGVIVVLIVLTLLWRYGPLGEYLTRDRLVEWGRMVSESPFTPAIVLGVYIVGGLTMMPVTLLVAATGLVFGDVEAFVYAFGGSLLSAITGYGAGRLLGRGVVRNLAGGRLNTLSRQLAKRGILSTAIVRNLPIAPFTVINMAAGASAIRFWHYLLGTALGMAPGILAITVFAGRLGSFIRNPSTENVLITVGVGIAILAAGWLVRSRLSDRTGGSKGADAASS